MHRIVVLLAASLVLSCGGGGTNPNPPPPPPPPSPVPIATVSVALGANTILIGAVTLAAATPRDAQGNILTGRGATFWLSQPASVATITQAGQITAVAAGVSVISATIEGVAGSALLTVQAPPPPPAPVASVTVSVTANPIMVGQTSQATATTKDAEGNVLVGRATTWSAGQTAIATVSQFGLISGKTIGATTITATSEGQSGQAAITILAPTSFGTGTKRVGLDIGPGLYRSNNLISASCYWERLSGFGGTLAEILANDISGGPAVVAIAATDAGFNSSRCATWIAVTGPITTSPTAPFADGTFVVTSDVAPGTWASNGTDTGCYWARISSFDGTLDSIISNHFGPAPAVVTIAPSDVGFISHRCGTWSKTG